MNYLLDLDWRRESYENHSHTFNPIADQAPTSSTAIELSDVNLEIPYR